MRSGDDPFGECPEMNLINCYRLLGLPSGAKAILDPVQKSITVDYTRYAALGLGKKTKN